MRPRDALQASTLPPPNDRACVRAGLASVDRSGRILYDRDEVLRQWKMYPRSLGLPDFCAQYDIPYLVATAKLKLVQEYRNAFAGGDAASYRKGVMRDAVIARIGMGPDAQEAAAANLNKAIDKIQETAALVASYVHSKLARTSGSSLFPNLAVPTREVKFMADINARAAETLRVVLDIRAAGASAAALPDTGRAIKPVRAAKPVQGERADAESPDPEDRRATA